ncbi:hypothetical protein M9458_008771, partial [Cirrhinus mrigala]
SSATNCKTLQRTVNTATKIIVGPLPFILDIFIAHIVKDPHPYLPQSFPAPTI